MEHVIGVFGSLIKQPSRPYANLTKQARKVAEVNAIVAMWPTLERSKNDPRGSVDIGNGYILLGPRDPDYQPYRLSATEHNVLITFYSGSTNTGSI